MQSAHPTPALREPSPPYDHPARQAHPPGPPPPGQRAGGQIRSVQALRAIAALAVVAFHATVLWHDRAPPGGPPVQPWQNGNAGVDLFFAISGFIMVVSTRRLRGQPGAWRRFLRLRVLRVVPLYWLATAAKLAGVAAAPALALHSRPTLWNVVASLLFIPARNGSGFVSPVLVVGWTLSFEMLFYAAFALALGLAADPVTLVAPLMGLLAMVSPLRGADWPAIATLADPIVLEFVLGMLVAEAFLGHRLQAVTWPFAVLAGGLGLLCLALVPAGDAAQRVAIWGVAASITLGAAVAAEPWLDPWLPDWLVGIGEASYSLYLTHGFVLPVIGGLAARARLSTAMMGVVLVSSCLIASTLAALLVYRFVETPITRALRQVAGDHQRASLASPQSPV